MIIKINIITAYPTHKYFVADVDIKKQAAGCSMPIVGEELSYTRWG